MKQFIITTLILLLVLSGISFGISLYLNIQWVNIAFMVGALSLLLSTGGTATEAHLAMKTLGNYVPKNGNKLLSLSPLLVSSLLILIISFLLAFFS
ncbi:hypothetical protein [Halalkalibacter akibai]|uniref:Uncharacterized protein n=1 Tax=Halalkalibacter akibai (strain ATCC 43226 / DSM 21942 / CIP 109018 / JCM 9157 / 1139) TaxID=1236973 RepID=W4QZ97_HALA3|nr:hypothetical protein [Halalkalibacter akibai]GAE37237.1 hypothetical protein JCM9157_4505 [Halalkalibacter akibai JCM 9157]